MKFMLKYTFSLLLVLGFFLSNAQEVKTAENNTDNKDSIKPKTERYGLRLGIDLYKLTRSFTEKNYRGLELVGDFKISRKHKRG